MQFQPVNGVRLKSNDYEITLKFSNEEGAPTIGEALVNISKKRGN